jgi:transposase-like protein
MAASATFAFKAGVWFRRGRLDMVSPDSQATACLPSGRNSTYRLVQISATGSPLGGKGKSVQADETYYGNTSKRAKGYKKGHRHKEQIVALVEPRGQVRAVHVKTATKDSVREILVANAHRSSELHTDESNLYRQVGHEFAAHKTVEHGLTGRGTYVGPDGETVNAVENFFGIFKRGMVGTYHKCEAQHLQRYITEFEFRFNHRSGLGVNDKMRAKATLKGIEGKRLTYRRPD